MVASQMLFMLNIFLYVKLATCEDSHDTVYSDTPVVECAALCWAEDSCESFDVDTATLSCHLSSVRGARDPDVRELPESIYHHGLKTDLRNETSVCFSVVRLYLRHLLLTGDAVKENTTEDYYNVTGEGIHTDRNKKTRSSMRDSVYGIETCEEQAMSSVDQEGEQDRVTSQPSDRGPITASYFNNVTALKRADLLITDKITRKEINHCTWCMIISSLGLRNVALNKNTTQSSNELLWSLGSDNAVDGKRKSESIFGKIGKMQSCSHTATGKASAWWWVDLGSIYSIRYITIANREDCCWRRLSNFTLSIGNHLSADLEVNYTTRCVHVEPWQGVKTLGCGRFCRGRFVMIKLTNGSPLTLCEVEVYTVDQ